MARNPNALPKTPAVRGQNVREKRETVRMGREGVDTGWTTWRANRVIKTAEKPTSPVFSDAHLQELIAIQREIEREEARARKEEIDLSGRTKVRRIAREAAQAMQRDMDALNNKSPLISAPAESVLTRVKDLGYTAEEMAAMSPSQLRDTAAFAIPRLHDIDMGREDRVSQEVRQSLAEAHAIPTIYPPERPELAIGTLVDLPYARENEEQTPREWKERLGGLVRRLTGGAKERGEGRFESMRAYLRSRSAEIDAASGELGKIERCFRAVGEKYNKLGWKLKLAIGGSLGLGAAAFSAVSIPTALAFTGGLAVQRAVGMAGVFLKQEKKLQERESGLVAKKEEAMMKAVLYTLGMGAAIKEAVDIVGEHIPPSETERVVEWIRTNSEKVFRWAVAHPPIDPETATLDRLPTPVPKETVELQEITPQASRIVPETPAAIVPAPAEATTEVTNLPEVTVTADAVPASVSPPDGQDLTSFEAVDVQTAAAPAQGPPEAVSTSNLSWQDAEAAYNSDDPDTGLAEESGQMTAPEQRIAPDEAPTTTVYAEESSIKPAIDSPEPIQPVATSHFEMAPADTDQAVETAGAESGAENGTPSEAPVPEGYHEEQIPMSDPELIQAPAPEVIENRFGLKIPTHEAHIYADKGAKHLFVHGGSVQERVGSMTEYLKDKPLGARIHEVAPGSDRRTYRLDWHLINGSNGQKILTHDGPHPIRRVLGLFAKWQGFDGPDDFRKLIK